MQQTTPIQMSLFGKMSAERLTLTTEKTSELPSKKSSTSSKKMPLCLQFQKGDGLTQMNGVGMTGAWHTELLTLNIGESPNVGRDSCLSDVLEQNVPEKYYLSKKACQGILRRAESRGKTLPPLLKDALKEQIEWWVNRDVEESGSQE